MQRNKPLSTILRQLLAITGFAVMVGLTGLTPAYSQTFTPSVLHDFAGGVSDGDIPFQIVEASDNNLYGVSEFGGATNQGTFFKLTPTGSFTILHSFGSSGSDGVIPISLMLGIDGNFYGVTYRGGSTDKGTIFKTTPAGVVTILHTFSDGTTVNDSANPSTGLVQGKDGTLYGTINGSNSNPARIMYSITPTGSYSLIRVFSSNAVGAADFTLTDGKDGFFYGAVSKVDTNGLNDYGAVFRMTPTGEVHVFNRFVQGFQNEPSGSLLLARDGNFYGVTTGGGGGIFKLTTAGVVSTVFSFSGLSAPEGGNGPLAQDVNGQFYGSTHPNQSGASPLVFSVDAFGGFNILDTLASTTSWGVQFAPIVSHIGDLYLATTEGGTGLVGTIKKYTRSAGGSATHFLVTPLLVYPDSVDAGSSFKFEVTALDSSNNNAQGYNGTVHFTCSDGSAVMPADATLTSGYGQFTGTLNTVGSQTVTATDTTSGGITGTSAGINVPGAATHFEISIPSAAASATDVDATIRALDSHNDLATGYTGTLHFTSSDGAAVLPADTTLVNGAGIVSFTVVTAGNQTLTATDTVSSSISGTSNVIVVGSGIASYFVVSCPSNVTAGSPFTFIVTAYDRLNHLATGYTGTVRFDTNNPRSTTPAASTLTNGQGTFSATLTTAGSTSANFKITAKDVPNTNISGTSSAISVAPAAASGFAIATSSPVSGGTPFNFTVTAADPYGNVDAGYSGTIHFTSTDGAAGLPADATLTNGAGSFAATLVTNGLQTITATDTVNGGIDGTSSSIDVVGAVYLLIVSPRHITSGAPFNVTVTAVNRFNRVATGYQGTVRFWSNAGNAALPGNTTLVNGTATVSVTITGRSSYKISAVDVTTPSLHGTSGLISTGP